MWESSYSIIYQGIKKEDIWRLWTDINNWPKWQNDLDHCKIEGRFEVGNHFLLKPKGASPVKIIITKVEENKSFIDCTSFFGAKMFDHHFMEETAEGLKITSKILVIGPLKWLWVKLVADDVAKSVPDQIESLVKFARQQYE